MAEHVAAQLRGLGATARLVPGQRAPIVEGELHVSPTLPTLLFYDLYDVQPAEGQPGWTVPPFAAAIVSDDDGELVGRGAFNSKGPLFGFLATLRAFAEAGVALAVQHPLPDRRRGGNRQPQPRRLHHRPPRRTCRLRCRLHPYFGTNARGETIIRLGFKGLMLLEFRVTGGDWGGPVRGDVHALHGALVDSPRWHLVRALASLVDAGDRLVLDGLAELTPPPTRQDRGLIAAIAHDLDTYADEIGVARLKPGASLADLMFSNTLNIDALSAGQIETGDDAATLIPRTARAFADLRVVPGVAPATVLDLLRAHLDRRGFGKCRSSVALILSGIALHAGRTGCRSADRRVPPARIIGADIPDPCRRGADARVLRRDRHPLCVRRRRPRRRCARAERIHHARRHRPVHEVVRELPVPLRRYAGYARLTFQNIGPVASSLPARLLR